MSVLEHRRHGRADCSALLDQLAVWENHRGYAGSDLHVGDVGWALKEPDDRLGLHAWWAGDRLVACALVEPGLMRPRFAPEARADLLVAEAVAEVAERQEGEAWSDAEAGSAYRALLVSRGWRADAEPWVVLYADLTGPPPAPVPGVAPTGADVAARVAVQRAGFDGSTFTADAWALMASGPRFDPSLDLVARDDDGRPVAIATAWSAGVGRCGYLEPVATHRDHRGRGHGKRVVRAALAALADAGCSGAAVATPGSNVGGVALYESAGLHTVELIHALHRS